jgi:heparanase
MKKKIIIAAAVVVGSLFLLVRMVGLWGASGGIIDFVDGQFDPGPGPIPSEASIMAPERPAFDVRATIDLSAPIHTISPEYLSFALDASQLVGGKWWNPKADTVEVGSGTVHSPVFDFRRPRLHLLAAALAPAYLRIGGSESDKIYYDMASASPRVENAPDGYHSVMTARQWDEVNTFARQTGLKLVFTLNTGPSARDDNGAWVPANSESLLAYSAEKGYEIALWELGNELNIFWFIYGIQHQVPVDQYRKDLETARALVKKYTPGSRFAGQGGAIWPLLGEPLAFFFGFTPEYLETCGSLTDIASWHYYPQQSRRGPIHSRKAFPGRLLNPVHLDEAAHWGGKIVRLRDRHLPGKEVWLGETGNAQFGGEPGVSDVYISGLWWLDQLGLLARTGHSVVVRQTLAGMTYGMIEEKSLTPKTDYWNSLLWRRLMGRKVYEVTVSGESGEKVRVYAHSASAGGETGITVLAINLGHQRPARVALPDLAGRESTVYQVNGPDIFGKTVRVNGRTLRVNDDETLPDIPGRPGPVSDNPEIRLNPLSYTFAVFH